MAVTALISSAVYNIKEGSLKVKKTIDGRSTCTCTIEDLTGATHFQEGQRVTILDDIKGAKFDGVIEASGENNLYPNAAMESTLTIGDDTFLANKRYYSGIEYKSQYSGDIAIDLLTNALAGEGITASYASRKDQTKGNWQDGTLSNLIAGDTLSGGDLELAPAGEDVNFSSSSVASLSNALKLTGYVKGGFDAAVIYRKIWAGSQTIVSGDSLNYDVWIPSSNPSITASIDLGFSDGTFFSSYQDNGAGNDGQGLGPDPSNDLSGLASDTWYTRGQGVQSPVIGKTITGVYIVLYGKNEGNYAAYFRRISWKNSATTKIDVFNNTTSTPAANVQGQNTGFINANLQVVQTVEQTSATIATIDLSPVAIVKTGAISWTIEVVGDTPGTLTRESSLDGGLSWLPCTNGGVFPQLVAGMNVAGKSLQVRTKRIQSTVPDSYTSVSVGTYTVKTSYASLKTDSINTFSASNFVSGVNSNTVTNGDNNLTLIGQNIPYSRTADYNGKVTAFGIASGFFLFKKTLGLNTGSIGAAILRLDSVANTWQNFTAEIDIYVPSNSGDSSGLVFRTTNFGSGAAAFSYYAGVSTSSVVLQKGTNTTSGSSITTLATTTVSLTAKSTHRLKVIANGTNLIVYLDDVQMMSVTDSSFNIAGYFGLRYNNSAGVDTTVYYSNFGVTPALTGTWTSPAFSIASPGNYGGSILFWDVAQTPDTTSLAVNISYDNGATWNACTNGAAAPVLTAGQSLAALTSVKLQVVLTSNNASAFPSLSTLTLWILGAFSSSGYRISPALQLGNVGRAGSTLVSWSGSQPTGTTIAVDTSPDLAVYTQVGTGAESSAAIAGINTQPEPTIDEYSADSSRNYTSTSNSSGSVSSWSWNTASSRLEASGGSLALLIFNSPVIGADVDVQAIMDTADNGGLCWRYQGNQKDYYECVVHDASAVNGPNTIQLFKSINGTRTQIGSSAAIDFTRGTPHVIRANMIGSAITLYVDGVAALTASDSSITSAGYCGLRNNTNSGSSATFYQFRVQAYGDDLSGKQIFTRVRLTSTDPTVSPLVDQLSISARNANIQNGAFVAGPTKYSVLNGATNAIDKVFDDLCKQSGNYWWKFIGGQFYFQGYQTIPAPFAISNKDVLVSNAKIENSNDVYRNSQWLQGGIDVIPQTETLTGDNSKKTFTLKYAVDSITSITYNNTALTVGVNGADTGKDWYYKQGEKELNQDDSASALTTVQSIVVTYNAQIPITVNIKRDDEIARRAALDNSTGIIEEVENVSGLTKKQIIVSGSGKLDQYAVKGKKATFRTLRPGLDVGQLVCMFLSPFGISDGTFLITDIETSWRSTAQYGIQEVYDVTAIQGPIIGDYTRFIDNLTY